jgi:hypothetical protein
VVSGAARLVLSSCAWVWDRQSRRRNRPCRWPISPFLALPLGEELGILDTIYVERLLCCAVDGAGILPADLRLLIEQHEWAAP